VTGHTRWQSPLAVVAVLVAVLVSGLGLLSCSRGGSASSSSPTTTTAPVTTSPGQSPCRNFRGSTTSLASAGDAKLGFLIDAQAQVLDCLDKVTFFFDPTGGVPPGYTVRYQDAAKEPLTDCGEPITVPGNAFLVVQLQPAASNNPFLPEGEQQTYRGNLLLEYGPPHHLQVVQKTCDGAGTVNWIIGLDSVRPFLVDRAENPSRVSVLIG
jgi:hypothetical protein